MGTTIEQVDESAVLAGSLHCGDRFYYEAEYYLIPNQSRFLDSKQNEMWVIEDATGEVQLFDADTPVIELEVTIRAKRKR